MSPENILEGGSQAIEIPSVSLRVKVTEAIRLHQPIAIRRHDQLGDDIIYRWSYEYILRKLCEEERLDPGQILLSGYRRKDKPEGLNLSSEIDRGMSTLNPDIIPYHFYRGQLYMIGSQLGIPVDESDYQKVPQPLKTDYPPLDKFDQPAVALEAQRIKQAAAGRRIFVVAQSGSKAEKRFSDRQVELITKRLRELRPEAFIVWVSDKKFMRKNVYEKPDFFRQDAYPYENSKFKQGILSNIRPDGIDELIISDDINKISGAFRCADTLVATDSYWGWLGSGCMSMSGRNGMLQPGDAYILYTMADPDKWGVPGATSVESDALDY